MGGQLPVAMVAACPFPASRGTPIRIQQMGEALSNANYDVHVVTYHLGTDRPTEGIQIHRTRRVRFYKDFGAGPNYSKLLLLDPMLVRRLVQITRRHSIRIIHAHHFEGALCALAVKRILGGVKVVYDAHTSLREELFDYNFPLPKPLKKAASDILDSGIPRWCDHVVTVSERLRDDIIDHGVPPSKVTVIPLAVNAGEFPVIPTEHARSELQLKDRPIVVYTGNLAPFQGVDHLMNALVGVKRVVPNVHGIIVATPNNYYRSMVDELGLTGNVSFFPDMSFEQVRLFLAAANVVVLPRDNCVGFPVKLLNYLASGKPIVAFEGGMANVLDHLHNGYVVPNGDASAFAEGIIRCLKDPQLSQSMGGQARLTAGEFDLASMTRRLVHLYRDLGIPNPHAYAPA